MNEVSSFLLHHGGPHELRIDRGRAFLFKVIETLPKECYVTHHTTTTYHPKTNGLTVRFNCTLGDMLAKYISSDHSNWDTILPFVTYAYNSAAESTTIFSPFFLFYGCERSCLLDTILPYRPDVSEYTSVSQLCTQAEECRPLARTFTSYYQSQQKQSRDGDNQEVTFSSGSLIWLWIPATTSGVSSKLLLKYHVPYSVIERT